MDKSLRYLSLARKAGLAELGEEPAVTASQSGKAKLIIVASDASDHTWRKAKSLVAGRNQQLVRLPFTKDEMGLAIGRTSLAIAAITDSGIGASLVEALGRPEELGDTLQVLKADAAREKQRSRPGKPKKKEH